MLLSYRLFVLLIDVPCKSSHYIVKLPSVRDCHPDGGNCASEQDDRMRGGREDEEAKRMRGQEDVKRVRRPRGWEEDEKRMG